MLAGSSTQFQGVFEFARRTAARNSGLNGHIWLTEAQGNNIAEIVVTGTAGDMAMSFETARAATEER
jgi:hypothetical protein